MAAKNKSTFTGASVEEYLASRANAQQDADCRELMKMFAKITGQPARMWGPSIVGFGEYSYTYESGHGGDAPLAAFAIRGRELVVYLLCEGTELTALFSKLGKHRMTKCCLYFRKLADLDTDVLEKIVVGSIAEVQKEVG